MSAPSILDGFSVVAIVPLILAASIALLFWRTVVPRQLRGLQVAFETGPKRYEVHTITSTFGEARDLLQSRGMRFGVATYLFPGGTTGGVFYKTAPTVTFSPPTGTGNNATVTATIQDIAISGGRVNSLTITDEGKFYTSTPTVTIAHPGVSIATATIIIVVIIND